MIDLSELSSNQEANLLTTGLEEWQEEPQVLTYGAILICRRGKATLHINYKDWELHEGAVITVFPNDVVELTVRETDETLVSPESSSFLVEMLKYNPSLLREASLQLEQTVYSALRADRCRQDTPIVTNIINAMFSLLKVYFDQSECTCISQLVLCQLKAFFIGFHEYLLRNPEQRPDEVKSYRVRELFNRFMMLMERDYKISRDVNYYAEQMHITSKYLTNIVRQVTHHTPVHHRSICDFAAQDATQAQFTEYQGSGMGISFCRHQLLLPLFQETYGHNTAANKRRSPL